MANFKISQLTQLSTVDPNASLMIVQDGKNYRVTIKQLLDGLENIDVDLSKYYTKDEINNVISILNADIKELQTTVDNIDISNIYTKDEIDNIITTSFDNIEQTVIDIINENTASLEDADTQFDNIFMK